MRGHGGQLLQPDREDAPEGLIDSAGPGTATRVASPDPILAVETRVVEIPAAATRNKVGDVDSYGA